MQVTPKLMTAMAALTIRAVMERMVLFSSRLLVLPDPDGPEACVAVPACRPGRSQTSRDHADKLPTRKRGMYRDMLATCWRSSKQNCQQLKLGLLGLLETQLARQAIATATRSWSDSF